MNNTYKKGIVAASVALFASSFIACGDSSVQAPDVSGVTVDPAGIADNSDIQSSSSMLVIEPSSSSNTIIELSSSSEYIPEISSSSIKIEPVTPPAACKPGISGAITGCVVTTSGDYTWNPSEGNVFQGLSENEGQWYSFDDHALDGDTEVKWSIDDHELAASISLGASYEYPFAGVGFNVNRDISNWKQICLYYKSSTGFRVQLKLTEALDPETDGNKFFAQFNKNTIGGTQCIDFSKFNQESGWGKAIDLATALKNTTAIEFKFTTNAELSIQSAFINLK